MQDSNFVPRKSFFEKNAIVIKGIVILILVLLLLIPQTMVQGLISEREGRQRDAILEVSSKWGGQQTILGPVVTVPYIEYYKDTSKTIRQFIRYAHFLPDSLSVNGTILPEKRHRSIYDIVVYSSKLRFEGFFQGFDLNGLNVSDEDILWDKSFLSFGIPDLRGIEEQIKLHWNSDVQLFNPGVETNDVMASGIHSAVAINKSESKKRFSFSFDISLKGSERIFFIPVGKTTDVHISSSWSTPSFDGAFLPGKRDISEKGFSASWKVLHLNRNYPQSWTGKNENLYDSSFGVNLLVPVDGYQKSTRAAKYAILFIVLTFLTFFFVELKNKKSIHPFQYILVGLGLCLFYTLLVSISEYLNYNLAYLIASVMTIGLISLYTVAIFSNKTLSGIVSGILIVLYGFIFTIIQLEDYALLMGSVGLFLILAAVMYYYRKIDWYNMDGN